MPSTRGMLDAVAYNGYVYVGGGQNCDTGATFSEVIAAPINANGTLGGWAPVSGFVGAVSSPTTNQARRSLQTMNAYNGYLYMAGGTDAGPALHADVEISPLLNFDHKASYSKLIDLVDYGQLNSVANSGTGGGNNLTIGYKTACVNTLSSLNTLTSSGSVGGTYSTSSPIYGRYIWANVSIDDSQSATFPDTGSGTQITDLTYDFTLRASPDLYMRGGKSFFAETEQPLDTLAEAAGGC